jgi:hypothetical protein
LQTAFAKHDCEVRDFPELVVTANVWQLGEVADLEALTFNLAQIFI